MPRDTTGLSACMDMESYMAASMSQKAMVLSPTSACGGRHGGHEGLPPNIRIQLKWYQASHTGLEHKQRGRAAPHDNEEDTLALNSKLGL